MDVVLFVILGLAVTATLIAFFAPRFPGDKARKGGCICPCPQCGVGLHMRGHSRKCRK